MRIPPYLPAIFCAALIAALPFAAPPGAGAPASPPSRIVSLSPAITQTLCALGLEGSLAGVTRHCQLPAGSPQVPRLGFFGQADAEAIARLKPDLVLIPADLAHLAPPLAALGQPALTFDTASVSGFLRDLGRLGQLAGRQAAAAEIIAAFGSLPTLAPDAPRALFVLGSAGDCASPPRDADIIGRGGFYDDLLRLAGFANAYAGPLAYPRISREGLESLRPDLLILAAPGQCSAASLGEAWSGLWGPGQGPARYVALNDPQDTIPGPRALATLRKISGAGGRP